VNKVISTSEINLFLIEITVLRIVSKINDKHIRNVLFSRDSAQFGMVSDDNDEYSRREQSPRELAEFETVR
jgi:hypothetical protein